MSRKALTSLCVAVGAAAALPAFAATEGADQIVRAASGYEAALAPDGLRELGTLQTRRFTAEERASRAKSRSSRTATALVSDHWIYDASLELFFDADDDGYYRYLRVTFDVDSYYRGAWVYAVLYLSADGQVWELLHETDDFRVDGATPDDAYEVETELVSGYPPGDYDLLIEVYDADTGVFADEIGPAQTSAFALLPLEDESYDLPESVIVVHEHGGGALGWPTLLVLGGAAALRARRHGQRPAAVPGRRPRRVRF